VPGDAKLDAKLRASELEDERRALLRSIADLDAELAAGDITQSDYRLLRDRYTVRAASVLRALQTRRGAPSGDAATAPSSVTARTEQAVPGPGDLHDDASAPAPARRRRRPVLLWGAVALFAAAAVVLVVSEAAARLPGQTATGSISLSPTQQIARTLAQAETLEGEGKLSQALVLYRRVLSEDPHQEQALAEVNWLEFEAGVVSAKASLLSAGQAGEEKAARADPGAYAPHLYLGSMLLVEGQPAQAAAQFTRFLSSHPPVSLEQTAWPYVVRAFDQAGEPVPPAPAGVHG